MIESMQLAMASPAYRPGRMSTLERPLHHYLNGYLDRVLGEDDGPGSLGGGDGPPAPSSPGHPRGSAPHMS